MKDKVVVPGQPLRLTQGFTNTLVQQFRTNLTAVFKPVRHDG